MIRELKLKQENGITASDGTIVWPAESIPNCLPNTSRYVTDWIADV